MSKKIKTIQELLEEALVSEVEQPYEVPENWMWVRLGSAVNFFSGSAFPNQFQGHTNFNIPFYKVGSLKDIDSDYYIFNEDNTISEEMRVQLKAKLVPKDTILFAKIGEAIRLNRRSLVSKPACIDNNLMGFRGKENVLENKFLLYWSLKEGFYKYSQASAVPSIRKSTLENITIPLPPLSEQKRIAVKVEHLLSKIKEAKQLIEEAKETFELRRAAILDKAFRGELTAKWRVQKPIKLDNLVNDNKEFKGYYEVPIGWKWTELKNVTKLKSGYAFKSKDFVEQGIQLIRMGNLYKNELALDRNPVYLPLDYDEKLIEKYTVNNGEILLSLTGTKYKRDYGYAVRVKGIKKPLLLNQRILSLKPHFMDEYIFYYLQSSTFRDLFFSFETGGVNQGNVGSKAVESILIPIPPQEEAKEIETKLNNLLNNEKESLKMLIIEDRLETLKQSILSKAFRGKLGTNNSNEESAIELLKVVLQEQVK